MIGSNGFLILAVIVAIFFPQIEEYFKTLIPNDKKRDLLLTGILLAAALVYGVIAFQNLIGQQTLAITLLFSGTPFVLILAAKLIRWWKNKDES